jgi:voltage-gated potassium channel Kch
MFRNLMKVHDVLFTCILVVITLALYVILIMEFETKNLNIASLPEGIYFLIVTMTTVGYGDLWPLGNKGQLTILNSIMLGVIFEGMFLIAWKNYMEMDSS